MDISPRRILQILLSIIAGLLALHLGLQALAIFGGYDTVLSSLVDCFDVDNEVSVPTWFSQFLLLAIAITAWIVAKNESSRRFAWQWRMFAILFVAMSIDEGASFHETVGVTLGQIAGVQIHLGFMVLRDWVFLALIAIVVLGLLSLRFFGRLPVRTNLLLLLGLVIFFGGALVWETLHFTTFNFAHEDVTYVSRASAAVEEGLEMIGASVIWYAVADYASQKKAKLTIRVKD